MNRRMRAAEEEFRPIHRKTRSEYIARLRRTAMSVPVAKLRSIIGSMVRSCKAVVAGLPVQESVRPMSSTVTQGLRILAQEPRART